MQTHQVVMDVRATAHQLNPTIFELEAAQLLKIPASSEIKDILRVAQKISVFQFEEMDSEQVLKRETTVTQIMATDDQVIAKLLTLDGCDLVVSLDLLIFVLNVMLDIALILTSQVVLELKFLEILNIWQQLRCLQHFSVHQQVLL